MNEIMKFILRSCLILLSYDYPHFLHLLLHVLNAAIK